MESRFSHTHIHIYVYVSQNVYPASDVKLFNLATWHSIANNNILAKANDCIRDFNKRGGQHFHQREAFSENPFSWRAFVGVASIHRDGVHRWLANKRKCREIFHRIAGRAYLMIFRWFRARGVENVESRIFKSRSFAEELHSLQKIGALPFGS